MDLTTHEGARKSKVLTPDWFYCPSVECDCLRPRRGARCRFCGGPLIPTHGRVYRMDRLDLIA